MWYWTCFTEQCEQDKARVLVHCMSGKNRWILVKNCFIRLFIFCKYVGFLERKSAKYSGLECRINAFNCYCNFRELWWTTRIIIHVKIVCIFFDRSPAVVMAYLVKSRKWTLDQSYQWVKERRPPVDINPGIYLPK